MRVPLEWCRLSKYWGNFSTKSFAIVSIISFRIFFRFFFNAPNSSPSNITLTFFAWYILYITSNTVSICSLLYAIDFPSYCIFFSISYIYRMHLINTSSK